MSTYSNQGRIGSIGPDNSQTARERKEELDRQSSQNGNGNDGGASGSQGRQKKPMPNCEVCKKLPRSPHAVYCCGAMYCQDCLLSIMSQAQQRGEQPMCINPTCQKPMGEKPQVKTKRGQQVAEDTRPIASQREGTPRLDSAEPQPKIARVMNQSGPALFNQMGQPLTATVLRPQRAGAAPIPTFVSNVTGQIVQPGQYSRAMFHAGATAEPVLSGGSRIQGPRSNVSSGRNTPVGSLPSLPVTEHGRPFAKPANETSTTTMMAPNSAESCPSIAIASAGTQSSNGRVPLQPAVKSEMAKKVMENEYMPRIPNPYEIEERRKLEKENDERKREKAYVEDDPGIVGPTCLICWDNSKNPLVMHCCSKTFCQKCVIEALRLRQTCPSCGKRYAPDDVTELAKPLFVPGPVETALQFESSHKDIDVKEFGNKFRSLDEFTISKLIDELSHLREEKYKERKNEHMRIISLGLNDFIKKCKYEVVAISRQMEAAIQDKKFIDGGCARECSLYGGVTSAVAHPATLGLDPADIKLDLAARNKNDRLKNHFDAFSVAYYDIFNKYSVYSNEDPDFSSQNRINSLAEVTDGITKYAEVKRLGVLNYDVEPNPSMSIISSLEFDSTGRRFVVAGVTRKIKIFDFEYFLNNPKKPHFPEMQLMCKSKISNVSWSPDDDNILASSDYDGHVGVWDVGTGSVVRIFQEHEKRCWTVNFNNEDPKLMASGSDDAKVKLWNINCERSVAQIEAKVNVCCVYFSPSDRNNLVFGSADHCVHHYDIRNVNKPVAILRGHKKAVSYVRYINNNEVVSASTDSSLRVWNLKEQRCTKILRGHINEKNFVGLSGSGDHVMCGSENSKAFFYFKGLSEPLCSYTLGKENAPDEDPEGFVSSVCWKKNSNYALVANSMGKVHLVEMS